MPDAAYAITRRVGRPVTVVRATQTDTNPETGERSISTDIHNIRNAARSETSYNRIIKAKMAQIDVGKTTFMFWVRDISFTVLNTEDYIITESGEKFQVVTSAIEGSSFVVTTNHVIGNVGKQEIQINAENDLGLGGAASVV